jgi:hypothetical protein
VRLLVVPAWPGAAWEMSPVSTGTSRGAFMPLRRSNSRDSGSYISASRRSRALARRLSPNVYLLAAASCDSPSPIQALSPKREPVNRAS